LPEIIVNTSPLQYLHQLNLLELLPLLFQEIIVCDAVILELARGRQLGLVLPIPENLSWVKVNRPIGLAGTKLAGNLGPGESSSLVLAVERPGSWLVLDDRLARETAKKLGIPLLGTAGVLLRAKQAGHISSIAPVLDQLDVLGFRLKASTRQIILKLAGEG
jgi:predicted nucleic acid-binding protein